MCGTEVRLVELNQRDIPGLIALSDSVGWDYDEPELVTILSAGRGFGHKTEQEASYPARLCCLMGRNWLPLAWSLFIRRIRGEAWAQQRLRLVWARLANKQPSC